MLNTSTAPLALEEDFDNLSIESATAVVPDQNHNIVPRKRPPPVDYVTPTPPTRFTFSFPTPPPVKRQSFRLEEPDNSGFCNPALLIATVYFAAAMFFLVGLNMKGLTLFEYPWIGNLLSYDYQDLKFVDGVIILQIMWCVHFVRKCAQTLFLHRYHGKIVCVVYMGMLLYHSIFGMLVGWSLNFYLGYRIPKSLFLVPGIFVFAIGEAGNLYSFWLLKQARLQPCGLLVPSTFKRDIPSGFLFDCMNYPQFAFEILTWIGFYLCTHTIAAGAFLCSSSLYVMILVTIGHFQMKKNYMAVKQPWQG